MLFMSSLWRLTVPRSRAYSRDAAGASALHAACVEYFAWAEDHPIEKHELVAFRGEADVHSVPHARVFTRTGLLTWLGIGSSQWRERASDEHLGPVVAWAEAIIYEQKFTGAAVGAFSPSFIARDLGMADRTEVSGPSGTPIATISADTSVEDAAEIYRALREGLDTLA